MSVLSMREMLRAGVHFGHRTRFRHPKMESFIYGAYKFSRENIHIIDLEQTKHLFKKALAFVESIAENNGKILFVGTKRAARGIIESEAKRCGMYYANHRWLGGTFTNYKTVRQSIKKLKELEKLKVSGDFESMIKKEALALERRLQKLQKSLGGIKDMPGLPDAIFVIDVGHEQIAVSEANKLGIPVVGVVDTNHSPEEVSHFIPGNDDSASAIKLYVSAMADAVLLGQKKAKLVHVPVSKSNVSVAQSDVTTEESDAETIISDNTIPSDDRIAPNDSDEAMPVTDNRVR